MKLEHPTERAQRCHVPSGTRWEWDPECACWWLEDCPDHCIAAEVGDAEAGGSYWHVDFCNGDGMSGREPTQDAAMTAACRAIQDPCPHGDGTFVQ